MATSSLDPSVNLNRHIQLKLAALGIQTIEKDDNDFLDMASSLLESYREKSRLLSDYLSPADFRIQRFLERYLGDIEAPRLPPKSFVLDRPGLAKELSLPAGGDHFSNEFVDSYRLSNGVLHNPRSDRRTTAGSFHVAEGGLPISADKRAVPKHVFANLLHAALNPSEQLMSIPYHSQSEGNNLSLFVSLLLRPIVCPEIPGQSAEKTMEIRFFAPGSLVSNLDFVERIFGNAGDPYLSENDAGLDTENWSGQTGCIILAPHLPSLRKKDLGLPHWNDATARQRDESMCWQQEDELYNDGKAFKITARDEQGVIITILGDNYFGYSKKEVKTQLSYAANMYGRSEEEHAGGALVFTRYNHGEDFGVDPRTRTLEWTFDDVLKLYSDRLDIQPEGHAIDKNHPKLIYVPEDLRMELDQQQVKWTRFGKEQQIKLQPGKVYMHPAGYKISMEKHPKAPEWRLIGTEPEGTLCHKPYTVSGGGKSEISKSIQDTVIYQSAYVDNIREDMKAVDIIFRRDYSRVLRSGEIDSSAVILDPSVSLGSVIRLLTPSEDVYTDTHNNWLAKIPDHIFALVFIIKRYHRKEWGNDWRSHFSSDVINGNPGHELRFDGRKLEVGFLRVGLRPDGSWRVFKLRQDFVPAEKIQMEDDITASVIVPKDQLSNSPIKNPYPAVKLVQNCEQRLFQRPDDAIIRGHDEQTEIDFAQPDNFFSNYQPLDRNDIQKMVDDVIGIQEYTAPMREHLIADNEAQVRFGVASSHPRRVNGEISKNPRYLQVRDDLRDDFPNYVAEMGARLHRRIPADQSLTVPVDAVLMGRRNNPPEPGIRPLAVYGPLHYQELPELFMDLITSVTGKSPSTTGAGSEGALTKEPFNALRTTADLNAALVGLILTGYPVFSTAAGHIGATCRMDHDISLLIPEIWSRLPVEYRDPNRLLAEGLMEKIDDFEHQGRTVPASRLGWRITTRFSHKFLGRIFDSPTLVFSSRLLQPETQDLNVFIDGIDNIVDAQRIVAQRYIDDGSIEEAVPPLKALLSIMATGLYQGKDLHHLDIRSMFDREAMFASNWYQARLQKKQQVDIHHWSSLVDNLQRFLTRHTHEDIFEQLGIKERLIQAEAMLNTAKMPEYLDDLKGSLGADPLVPIDD